MQKQYTYGIATLTGLERIWEKNIANNRGEDDWVRWRREYIDYHMSGMSKTFLVSVDGEPGNLSPLGISGIYYVGCGGRNSCVVLCKGTVGRYFHQCHGFEKLWESRPLLTNKRS